jgi:hypothetical protein
MGNNIAFHFSTGFTAEQQENKDIRIVHERGSHSKLRHVGTPN